MADAPKTLTVKQEKALASLLALGEVKGAGVIWLSRRGSGMTAGPDKA